MKDTSTHFINRRGLRLFVRTFIQNNSRELVFLVHGLSDNHATTNMLTLRQTFIEQGYNVVVWDATNSSWGQSEGRFEDANFTRHYNDLVDVINWAKGNQWYRAKFTIAGFSLGGMAAGTYAARHNSNVKNLILVAPIVSGEYLRKTIPWPIRTWWHYRGTLLLSRKFHKRLSWDFLKDGLDYNLLLLAENLTMPTLIIGASRDIFVRQQSIKLLFNAIPHESKQLHILPKANHRFTRHQEDVKRILYKWLQRETGLKVKVASGIRDLIARLR